ncbi:phosphatidylinositol 3- and 4-kinase [Ceratobasidium sp. AG-Ba]|nr:phosphatidylinositol 3- and 4-kinase [Ceratobasidium sp. AG-Ba]
MFDFDLSMKISQHLFNIQFERYLHETVHKQAFATSPEPRNTGDFNDDSANTSQENPLTPPKTHLSFDANQPDSKSEGPFEAGEPVAELERKNEEQKSMKSEMEYSNMLLVRVADRLDDMKRFMIASQHSLALALNNGTNTQVHKLIPSDGSLPNKYHWHYDAYWRFMKDLAQAPDWFLLDYLRLHGIGDEFIDGIGASPIPEDKKAQAVALIREHMGE